MIAIRISVGAYEDLDEAFNFYERQEPGLGEYFRSCLNNDIEGLKITAGIHLQTFRDYHRLLSRVFPYAVHYNPRRKRGHRLGSGRLQKAPRLDHRPPLPVVFLSPCPFSSSSPLKFEF